MLELYLYPQRSHLKTVADGVSKAHLTLSQEILPKMVIFISLPKSNSASSLIVVKFCPFVLFKDMLPQVLISVEKKHSSNYKRNTSREMAKSQYCVMGRFLHL